MGMQNYDETFIPSPLNRGRFDIQLAEPKTVNDTLNHIEAEDNLKSESSKLQAFSDQDSPKKGDEDKLDKSEA